MFIVKMRINGHIVNTTYDDEVKTESRHETREAAEAAVRGYYRDFVNDGAKPDGTDTDFTVSIDSRIGRISLTEHFYIVEE